MGIAFHQKGLDPGHSFQKEQAEEEIRQERTPQERIKRISAIN
jgi:hypothetical protein